MVNVPGRSKGCLECRQRKQKCDGVFPECQQCTKRGLRCSGPRTSAIFVHALPAPPKHSAIKQLAAKSQNGTAQSQAQTVSVKIDHSPLAYHQPDRADIFDCLFVSHFIESFGFRPPTSVNQPPTWLDELSVMIASPNIDLARRSIRAASMYFYGILARDVSIQAEACRWYSASLQGLRILLSRETESYTDRVICATVMLTHFENLVGTYRGWLQHVQAAAKMLEICGPQKCGDGFPHQIFRHIRLLTFAAAMLKSEQHVFSSHIWKTIPFDIYPKTAFDQCVDLLFSMLPCLSVAERIIESTTAECDSLVTELSTTVSGLLSQLHAWWSQLMSMPSPLEANAAQWRNTGEMPTEGQFDEPSHFPLIPHSDMPTAALGSLYDAANIVVLHLLYLESPHAYLYEERIQKHVDSILSAKEYIAAIPGPTSGRGLLMVEFPLYILDTWSNQVETANKHSSHAGNSNRNHDSSNYPPQFFGHVASYIHQHKMGTQMAPS